MAAMSSDLELALLAAGAGAEVVLAALASQIESPIAVDFKGDVDPVTQVDRAAEAAILTILESNRPKDGVLSEESGGNDWRKGRVWICDPLDGTVNFVHGLPQVSVSVALWEDGQPLIGVVHDVARNEVFYAEAGHGARLNGTPISVSRVSEPRQALIVTGFPYDRNERAAAYLPALQAVLTRYQGIRRIGSAALDLCWTACGRLDGYWEYVLKPWDAAAGILIVEEAGGIVTDGDGHTRNLEARATFAGNPEIQRDLLATLAGLQPAHLT